MRMLCRGAGSTALAENRTNSTRSPVSSVGIDYLQKWLRCALMQGSEAPHTPPKRPRQERREDRQESERWRNIFRKGISLALTIFKSKLFSNQKNLRCFN